MGIFKDIIKPKIVGEEIRRTIKSFKQTESPKETKIKCPKCKKADLREDISYRPKDELISERSGHYKTRYYKVFNLFCLLCDFEKKKEIEISYTEFKKEK